MTEDENQAAAPESETPEGQASPQNPNEGAEQAPVDPLEEARAEAVQMKDKLMRMAADFDNFRKRSRKEVEVAEKKGRDGLLNDLLPVFDNLERATSHASSSTAEEGSGASVKGLVDGITLVMKQFRDALSRLGIERVESVGQPFDPSVHEAIQHLETAEYPPGFIAAEVQPGYRQGDRLVRPAMVVVAKAPTASPESTANDTSADHETDPLDEEVASTGEENHRGESNQR